ncbi:hypothetical protein HMPREF9621_00133 [Cutibacterium modestum HL037PA2]|nr:hypothetical protein HMPREF9621_00133 [Cutibacterium modestum HL037PA2]
MGFTGMLTAFYEQQDPQTGHREAPAGLCLVERRELNPRS